MKIGSSPSIISVPTTIDESIRRGARRCKSVPKSSTSAGIGSSRWGVFDVIPIHSLSTDGDANILREAIKHNYQVDPLFDVDNYNRSGVTALQSASFHGKLENVRVLLECGADPNRFSRVINFNEQSRTRRSCNSKSSRSSSSVDASCSDDGNNGVKDLGATALHFAVSRGLLDVVQMLHMYGGNLFLASSSNDGKNCFEMAVSLHSKRSSLVRWLKNHIIQIPRRFFNKSIVEGLALESECVCMKVLDGLGEGVAETFIAFDNDSDLSFSVSASPAISSFTASPANSSVNTQNCYSKSVRSLSPRLVSSHIASKLPLRWSRSITKMQIKMETQNANLDKTVVAPEESIHENDLVGVEGRQHRFSSPLVNSLNVYDLDDLDDSEKLPPATLQFPKIDHGMKIRTMAKSDLQDFEPTSLEELLLCASPKSVSLRGSPVVKSPNVSFDDEEFVEAPVKRHFLVRLCTCFPAKNDCSVKKKNF